MAGVMNRRSSALALAALVLVLTGCGSQIAGLAPVGGGAMTSVKFAATNVLLENELGILDAPVCTQTGDVVSCVGSLTDGQPVVVRAEVATKPHTMTVTVGSTVVYDGDVQTVLDDAARAAS